MNASEHVRVAANDEHTRTLINNVHPSSERSSHGYHLLTSRLRDDRASGHGYDPCHEAPVNRRRFTRRLHHGGESGLGRRPVSLLIGFDDCHGDAREIKSLLCERREDEW